MTVDDVQAPARRPRRGVKPRTVQAWIELLAEDPEALSAEEVARARLAAGAGLVSLRRMRLVELRGPLPARREVEALLHRSIQFYNPHKERCHVRAMPREPVPVRPGEVAVLVWDRDGERRDAAERWWDHQTGDRIQVREGAVWLMTFEPDGDPGERARRLAVTDARDTGLLCNPNAQMWRLAIDAVPLEWFGAGESRPDEGAPR
jgi:hypothetical protein